MSKTVLFQAIPFSISIQFSSYWLIDRALSGATTLGQSGFWSDDNEGELSIPQSPSITGTLSSDCLVSYTGHSLGGVLLLCRDTVGIFYSPSRLGNRTSTYDKLCIEKLKSIQKNHTGYHYLLLFEFFTPEFPSRVWETVSLLKSPGLFSLFWPILIML